jgi:hypothetical protein
MEGMRVLDFKKQGDWVWVAPGNNHDAPSKFQRWHIPLAGNP